MPAAIGVALGDRRRHGRHHRAALTQGALRTIEAAADIDAIVGRADLPFVAVAIARAAGRVFQTAEAPQQSGSSVEQHLPLSQQTPPRPQQPAPQQTGASTKQQPSPCSAVQQTWPDGQVSGMTPAGQVMGSGVQVMLQRILEVAPSCKRAAAIADR